jgi:hypothetical protein
MSRERELLEVALDFINTVGWGEIDDFAVITLSENIKELLAQPEKSTLKLRESPPKRKPLSEDELKTIAVADEFLLYCDEDEFIEIARAIEKAHGIGVGNE